MATKTTTETIRIASREINSIEDRKVRRALIRLTKEVRRRRGNWMADSDELSIVTGFEPAQARAMVKRHGNLIARAAGTEFNWYSAAYNYAARASRAAFSAGTPGGYTKAVASFSRD